VAAVTEHPFAPVAVDEEGAPRVCCESCGSTNIELDGWDIDKCHDCGHWRYRGAEGQQ
jgi:ribosomal protein L37AE/L43A